MGCVWSFPGADGLTAATATFPPLTMMQAGGMAGQELDYASFLMTFDYLVLPYLDTKSLLALGSTAVGLTTYRRKVRGMLVSKRRRLGQEG